MVCPIVKSLGLLSDATPIGEGTGWAELSPTNVSGTAVNLVQNLTPISAQLVPLFGVGDRYKRADQDAAFRIR